MNAQTTEEDPRMLAFFDSLVQREIEALTTETDTSSEEDGVGRGGHRHSSGQIVVKHCSNPLRAALLKCNAGIESQPFLAIQFARNEIEL